MNIKNLIFSINQKEKHYIITFLGIRIKYRKENFDFLFPLNSNKQQIPAGGGERENNKKPTTSEFLKKYLYAADLAKKQLENIPEDEINKPSNFFWTMWLQDDIPEIVQMCLCTLKKYYPEIIIITEKNLSQYIDVPEYISSKYKQGIIRACHFSDYIRVCLLDKYGGTWLDSTCYMLNKIPKYILKENFFIMQDINKKTISNFFIHSTKNHFFVKTMRIFLEEYWKNENITIDYFFFHSFFLLFVNMDETAKNLWNNLPIGLNHNTWLIQKTAEKDVNYELLDYLLQTSFMYKINRKDTKALNNPNGWYNFLLNKYRAGEFLENIHN